MVRRIVNVLTYKVPRWDFTPSDERGVPNVMPRREIVA